MTCREKLAKEHPECISDKYTGGCKFCPTNYGYLGNPIYCPACSDEEKCTMCWDREIPGTEKSKPDISWDRIKELIDDAMEKRDRSVSLYFNPDTGMSVSVYPWPDAEDLYEQYKNGLITENDFREKIGLPRVEIKQDPRTYRTMEVPNTDDWK